jgi:hypothetical protein
MNYANSTIEMNLGDHVSIKRLFRRSIRGVVAYLPGVSPTHPEMTSDDGDDFAIRVENGEMWAFLYYSDRSVPSRIVFISRGSPGDEQLLPDEKLY